MVVLNQSLKFHFSKKNEVIEVYAVFEILYVFEVVVLNVCGMIHLMLLFLLVWIGGWVELGELGIG